MVCVSFIFGAIPVLAEILHKNSKEECADQLIL